MVIDGFMIAFYAMWLIVGIAIIMLHELGHVGMFAWFGRKTTIKVTWFGLQAGEVHDSLLLTPLQNIGVLAGGILLGWLPVLMINQQWLSIAYWLTCIVDVFNIFIMSNIPREYMHRRYRDYVEATLKQAEVR